jgi:tetratricopeptide (TPR) repeat protein
MPDSIRLTPRLFAAACALLPLWAAQAAETYVPASDDVVLERIVIPRGMADGFRELRSLRAALAEKPTDPVLAVAFARRAIELGREEADPRYFGYAESALQPWWSQPAPPEEIRLLRATLRQQRHDFAGALEDLDALIAADGSNAQAKLTRAVVLMVQGRPKQALHDCAGLIGRTGLLTMTTCIAQAKSLMGAAATAGPGLENILDGPNFDGTPAERSWSLTVAAELAQRRGDAVAANRRFEEARAAVEASGTRDPYLVTADADYLLEQGRAAEVRERLADYVRVDNALLRLALAEQLLKDPAFETHVRLLQARFDETRERGDTVHLREEAMFELRIRKDPVRALALAAENWQKQREPIDARLFVDAALAAKQPQQAAPVLAWMRETGIDDPGLLQRADKLRAAGVTS